MLQKTLMKIQKDQMTALNDKAETGMNFQIAETPMGYVAILEDGDALPLFHDLSHYDIEDLLAGNPIPKIKDPWQLVVSSVFLNRADAITTLSSLAISPKYTGSAGAFPLIVSDTLTQATIFYRFLSTIPDPRFVSNQLTGGTYLTTARDSIYANSGFATVGRYALPIPLPCSHVLEYELPIGTTINVGTVAPMFGQAGGGVEIQLPTSQSATLIGTTNLSAY